MGYDEAVQRAMARLAADDEIETTWASSLASFSGDQAQGRQLAVHEGMLFERHRSRSSRPRRNASSRHRARSAATTGWPAGQRAVAASGAHRPGFGGVGMRRGSRHPRELRAGDPLDFWRVEVIESPHLLRLASRDEAAGSGLAAVRGPARRRGRSRGANRVVRAARHSSAQLYWYGVRPFHRFVFPGLIRAVRERAEATRPGLGSPLSTDLSCPPRRRGRRRDQPQRGCSVGVDAWAQFADEPDGSASSCRGGCDRGARRGRAARTGCARHASRLQRRGPARGAGRGDRQPDRLRPSSICRSIRRGAIGAAERIAELL